MTRALRSLLAEFNRTGHYMYFLDNGIPAWTSNGYVAIRQVVTPTSNKATILDKLPKADLFLVGEYGPVLESKSTKQGTAYRGAFGWVEFDGVYLKKLLACYPKAQLQVGHTFDPLRLVEGGEVVALLMPTQ